MPKHGKQWRCSEEAGGNSAVQRQNTVTRIFDKSDFLLFMVSVVDPASARQVLRPSAH